MTPILRSNFLLLLGIISVFSCISAQTPWCNAMERDAILRSQPGRESLNDFEIWMQRELASGNHSADRTVITIPVIFHVIYTQSYQNIDFSLIQEQLDVLNEDFRRLNPDTNNTLVVFRPVAADCEIEFCLAQRQPDGSPTDGVNRVFWADGPFDSGFIDYVIKPTTIWDPENYFNIWIIPLSPSNLAGYAQFPVSSGLPGLGFGGDANSDGIVVGTQYCNRSQGRVATHEAGHWLGLRHIWGDGGCGVDDFCGDTPDADSENYGCSLAHNSCGNLNMVQNYMDYSGSGCMNIFTQDQKARMDAVMSVCPRRKNLKVSLACQVPLVAPDPVFSAESTLNCPSLSVQFFDESKYLPTSWLWSFPGGSPATSTDQNPVVTYSTTGYFDVTLTSTNAYGTNASTQTSYITVSTGVDGILLNETFESGIPTTWTIMNPDADGTWSTATVEGNSPGFTAAYRDLFLTTPTGRHDGLITPSLDLSDFTSVMLEFEHAYRLDSASATGDSLLVLISTDGGLTWPDTLFADAENGSGNFATDGPVPSLFIPATESDWCFFSGGCNLFSLSPWEGFSDVKIRFETIDFNGNHLYLDNVRVTGNCSGIEAIPICALESDREEGCPSFTVNYTDLSLNMPTSWAWSFPGGIPSTSASSSPTITYSTIGTYDISLIVSNATGSDTLSFTNHIGVFAPPPAASLVRVGDSIIAPFAPGYHYQWFLNGLSLLGFDDNVFYPVIPAKYNVMITDEHDCSVISDTINFDFLSSRMDLSHSSDMIRIFPNPAKNLVTIDAPTDLGIQVIQLKDALGRLVMERPFLNGRMELDINELSKGMYFVQLVGEDGIFGKKLIVE